MDEVVKKFQFYKNKDKTSLSKQEIVDYLKFLEELKNITAQLQDFAEISQRIKGDQFIVQNAALEAAKEMLGEVERWPFVDEVTHQRPKKLKANAFQNELAARTANAAAVSDSQSVQSNLWNLPPQPLTPFESAMIILNKTPNGKEQTYSWIETNNQYAITRIDHAAIYDVKKSPGENAGLIRDLDRMLLAYALGRDPSLLGARIEIDGTDPMSRAILMRLCDYHHLPYKNLQDTNPITDPILLAEIEKQAVIECKNQPQIPRTNFSAPPIMGTAPSNLGLPQPIAVDNGWAQRHRNVADTLSQLESKIVTTLASRQEIQSVLHGNIRPLQNSVTELAQEAYKIVQNDPRGEPFSTSNYQIYLNMLDRKQKVFSATQDLLANFDERIAKLLKWPENPSQFQAWTTELQKQQIEIPAMINQLRTDHPDSDFAQAMATYLEKQWDDYNTTFEIVAKLQQHQLNLLSNKLSPDEMQRALQEIQTGREQLAAIQNDNADKPQSEYLPDLIFQIEKFSEKLENFEDILQDVADKPVSRGQYVALPAMEQKPVVVNKQYGQINLPAGNAATRIVDAEPKVPSHLQNQEYQAISSTDVPKPASNYQPIPHPDNQQNQRVYVPIPISSNNVPTNAADHYQKIVRQNTLPLGTTLSRENQAAWANLPSGMGYGEIGLATHAQSNTSLFASNLPTLVLNQRQWEQILAATDNYKNIELNPDAAAQVLPSLPISQQYQARPDPIAHGQYVQVNQTANVVQDAGQPNSPTENSAAASTRNYGQLPPRRVTTQNRARGCEPIPGKLWEPISGEDKENTTVNAPVGQLDPSSGTGVKLGNSIGNLVQKKIAESPDLASSKPNSEAEDEDELAPSDSDKPDILGPRK